MNSHDSQGFLGNLGVNRIHPPSSAQAYNSSTEVPGLRARAQSTRSVADEEDTGRSAHSIRTHRARERLEQQAQYFQTTATNSIWT